MDNIKYLDGVYEARLLIFPYNSNIRKPSFLASNKKKNEFWKTYDKLGSVQIGVVDKIYILRFTSNTGEEVIFNLNEISGYALEETRTCKNVEMECKMMQCIWNNTPMMCKFNLRVFSGSFGKRLRRMGLSAVVTDMNPNENDDLYTRIL